ncbi:hypothetical protein EGH24_02320 [Halonotius terrestris]|uniref:Uncharacterized protein n=1 Tax=Halonotius terrestris TaxID=2487750 RepID=A0A8J8PE06_9EURY|nr:hypothetical protein [Halonotius terrestris]TQQ83646.1 hypothetical protein EGH24_02320 [Halonotius terrestris]
MEGIASIIKKHIHPALSDYFSSTTFQTTGLVGTVCWILSSLFGSKLLQVIAAAIYVLPASSYYLYYRPFGIDISYTPTTKENGKRTADKVAEQRNEAHIQNGECVITFLVDISPQRDDFHLEFSTPDEVYAEFRDIPLEEHDFEYDPLTLSCGNISKRQFQVILEVFLEKDRSKAVKQYPLKVIDAESGRSMLDISIVDREKTV